MKIKTTTLVAVFALMFFATIAYADLWYPSGNTLTPVSSSFGGIKLTGTATSTATRGFDIAAGCYAIGGVCVSGGGSTNPGGSNGQVQFNNSSSFGGDQNFYWDNTNKLLGISTTSPWAKLSVGAYNLSVNTPLFAVATSSVGVATSTSFVIAGTGNVGIASSSPSAPLTIGGQAEGCESYPATSTSMTISWIGTCNTVVLQMGTSAFTVTFTNYHAGAHKIVKIMNPAGGTVGAVTWSPVPHYYGGVAPTQTTTANQGDAWAFSAGAATSTTPSTSLPLISLDGFASGLQ